MNFSTCVQYVSICCDCTFFLQKHFISNKADLALSKVVPGFEGYISAGSTSHLSLDVYHIFQVFILLYWFFHSASSNLQQKQLCRSHYVICCDHCSVLMSSCTNQATVSSDLLHGFSMFWIRDERAALVRNPQLLRGSLHSYA